MPENTYSPIKDEAKRAYVYRLALVLLAAAAAYRLLAPEDVAAWVDVVAAVLGIGGTGLATLNTSTRG